MQVGFIGAGRMAQAMAKGFITAGITKADKIIASCHPQEAFYLQQMKPIGCRTTLNNKEVVQQSEIVILAVKPHSVPDVLSEVSSVMNRERLLISVALGVTIRQMEQSLPHKSRVVRVMPNTPALVKEGATVFSCGSFTSETDGQIVKTLFNSVGLCEEVAEKMIDAVTGLSGSGPAYMFIAIEALADGGVKMGLPRDLAMRLAAQTLVGSGKMVLETGRHPGALKDDVCSPAGSTIEAVAELEKLQFRASLINAVQAATERSREISDSNNN